MRKTKKVYWIRFCGNFPAFDTAQVDSYSEALQLIHDLIGAVNFSFCYIMTLDAFGPCFLDIIRREEIKNILKKSLA